MINKRQIWKMAAVVCLVCQSMITLAQDQRRELSASISTERTNVFRNETITLTLSIKSTGLRLGQNFRLTSMPPEDDLISIGKFEELAPTEEMTNNQMYTTRHFRGKYRILKTGKITISPDINLQVETTLRSMIGFGRTTVLRSHTIKPNPVILNCSDIPQQNRPDNYGNAVGQFNLSIKISPVDVAVGDIITATTTISGNGYLEEATPPRISIGSNFKVYEPKIIKEIESGRIFEQIMIPINTNATEVGSVTFCYFDPSASAFKTITQGPFPLTFHPEYKVTMNKFIPADTDINQKRELVFKNSNTGHSDGTNNITEERPRSTTGLKNINSIITQKVSARFAPAHTALPLFEISAGESVKMIELKSEWVLIEYLNNRGWIPTSSVLPD